MSVLFTRRGGDLLYLNDKFEANSWEQIIKACQLNRVPDTWVVGNNKLMTIDNEVYQIDIIGKNHDVYSDGTGYAPLTFQMHDCHRIKHAMNGTDVNRDGWENSRMRTTRIPEFIALLPTEVQMALHEVNKLTSAGGTSNTIVTTADKVFLLSEVEVINTSSQSKPGEGTQYEYYAKGNSAVKKYIGVDSSYWLRSPVYSNSSNYCVINGAGAAKVLQPTASAGVAFAFCF